MKQSKPPGAALDRRTFLKGMGGLAVAGALSAHTASQPQDAHAAADAALPQRPNIVLILTDQERYPQWWPEGWAETNLPNRQRLVNNGLSFRHAFCNSAMCSPSRSTLFTGLYPAIHGVTDTLTEGGSRSPHEATLPVDIQTMGKMLASAGYEVHFRGKWHMSKGADGGMASTEDIEAYGFKGWIPTKAGDDTAQENFGGGCANHDARIAQEAVDFLNSIDPNDDTPFALIVSFANPHDVLAYPLIWDVESETNPGCFNYRDVAPECFNQGISLPPTYDEQLAHNFKPTAHSQFKVLAAGLGPLPGPPASHAEDYVNFYAYLQKETDQHIGAVLDALEAKPGLTDQTLVIRTSDHGEMGLSHGGLRQKSFNVYEETINVPLVIANPVLFPQPVTTNALASLIDLMPTLATLADVPDRDDWTFQGNDLTPIIQDAIDNPDNPIASVQESILFTYDDEHVGAPDGQNVVTQPNHIRCLRDERYKYALYFDPSGVAAPEYELYDLLNDPQEMENLANPANEEKYDAALHAQMDQKLAAAMAATGTQPYRTSLPLVTT